MAPGANDPKIYIQLPQGQIWVWNGTQWIPAYTVPPAPPVPPAAVLDQQGAVPLLVSSQVGGAAYTTLATFAIPADGVYALSANATGIKATQVAGKPDTILGLSLVSAQHGQLTLAQNNCTAQDINDGVAVSLATVAAGLSAGDIITLRARYDSLDTTATIQMVNTNVQYAQQR